MGETGIQVGTVDRNVKNKKTNRSFRSSRRPGRLDKEEGRIQSNIINGTFPGAMEGKLKNT